MTKSPAISIILVTDGHYDVCRRTMSYLMAQTIVDQIEMVLVCNSIEEMQPEMSDLEPFHSYQIVETGVIETSGHALAAGVPKARAELIMYAEEHEFPGPNWAEILVRTAQEHPDYVAYGWAMMPSNPGPVAWAHLYGQFSEAVHPITSGESRRLGGHHAMYRKSLLMEYEDRLVDVYGTEAVLQESLEERGLKCFITGDIYTEHTQVSDFRVYLRHEYLSQRTFAAARIRTMGWGWGRRLLYIAGSPLIPFVRLARTHRRVVETGRFGMMFPKGYLIMFAANCAGAYGEAIGYITGDSEKANQERMQIELHRFDYVADQDIALKSQHSPAAAKAE